MAQELISVGDAAELAGCSRSTICKRIRVGDLAATRIGERVWLVDRAAVLELVPTLSKRTRRSRAEAAAAAARSKRPKKAVRRS